MNHHQRRLAAALGVCALTVACTSNPKQSGTTTTTSTARSTTTSEVSTVPSTSAASTTTTSAPEQPGAISALRKLDPFAAYDWVPLFDDTTPYAGPPTPTSLDQVLLVETQQQALEYGSPSDVAALRAMLEQQGFAVQSSYGQYFHEMYKGASYNYEPLFVTTDALAHSWHLAFDKVLRDVEQQQLLPVLERFLTGAVAAARAQQEQLAGTPLASDAERATAYYEAAAALVGLQLGTTSARADDEIALAQAATGVVASPVSAMGECQFPEKFDGCVDYSLFLPRGHYTRTEELKRFFAGMSLLGQEFFGLSDTADAVLPGALVVRAMTSDPALLADWTTIYEPTAFLVGLADDVTPLEVAAVLDKVAATWRDDPAALAGLDTRAVAADLLAAHPTKIDPERAGIRLMGARFTLDAYALDQLAWPNVGTEAKPRVDVSALDVAAALGSDLARTTQLANGQVDFANYSTQLDAMTSLVQARQPADWAGTVYDAWLAALQPLLVEHGAAFPDFMQSPAWAAKSLQTALASYTELKHDTILYAKQGSAGEGEGPQAPEFTPRHWVEPDPVAFARLAAAAELLRAGLTERDLLPTADADLLSTFSELAGWLSGIATRELAGQVATDTENTRLGNIGSELEYLWFASADTSSVDGYPTASYEDSDAVVADIYRSSFNYLELGTGRVDQISVIVPLGDGRFELAVGAVSSYYEFRRPTTELRLTDEEWKAMLRQDPLPVQRPSWQQSFLLGTTTAQEAVPTQTPG